MRRFIRKEEEDMDLADAALLLGTLIEARATAVATMGECAQTENERAAAYRLARSLDSDVQKIMHNQFEA